MSSCRFCEARILFVRLDTGKAIPVNPIPDPGGNVAADWQGTALVGFVLSREKPLREGFHTYRPHKADCHPDKPRVPRPDSLFDTAGPEPTSATSPRRTS